MSDQRIVPFDAKPGLWASLWGATKKAIWTSRPIEAVRWWVGQRRIRKYKLTLKSREQGLRFDRRLFIQGLILAPFTPVPKLPGDIREAIVSEYLKTREGRLRLAMSMIQPIRRRIDYQSLSRKVFLVQQIPDGALPIYDKDPGVASIVVPDDEST